MNLKSQIHRINCFPYRHFECSREIFLALCSFFFPSQKVFHFPLSHIRHYPLLQERSLHFGRDDDTGLALSKHIRCTLREINPFPPPSFRAQREIFLALCSFLLSSQKVSRFPLSHIRRYTAVQERSLHFGRDDDTGIALSKHIRCTLLEINPFPHTVMRGAARNLPCTPSFLAPFAERVSPFPLSHIGRYTSVQERSLDFARDDDTGAAFSQHILYTGRGLSIPPYRHFERSEKSFLHSALSCFLRRSIPLFRCLT